MKGKLLKIKGFVVGALLALVCSASFAATRIYVCNGCSVAQTRQEAVDTGNGDFFYYDFINRTLTHWSISGTVPDIISAQSHVVTKSQTALITNVPITTAEQEIFNASQQFYSDNGVLSVTAVLPILQATPAQASSIRSLKIAGPVPLVDSNGYLSAFDVVSTPAYRQAAIDIDTQYSTHPENFFISQVRVDVATLVNVFTNNNILKTPINVFLQIPFFDGSSSVYQWNFITASYDYVPNSSKDAVGNPIPETAIMAAGGLNSFRQYVFPRTNAGTQSGALQVRNLNNLGINVQVVVIGGTWIVGCVNTGFATTCKAYPQ